MIQSSGRKPNYFFVVFGEDLSKPPVQGGVYPHDKGYIGGSGVSAGDIMLLYQNLGTRGVGAVTSTETSGKQDLIRYQYLPLCHPVNWDSLDDLQSQIPGLHKPLAWKGNWLQKINDTHFRAAIAGRQIDWP